MKRLIFYILLFIIIFAWSWQAHSQDTSQAGRLIRLQEIKEGKRWDDPNGRNKYRLEQRMGEEEVPVKVLGIKVGKKKKQVAYNPNWLLAEKKKYHARIEKQKKDKIK